MATVSKTKFSYGSILQFETTNDSSGGIQYPFIINNVENLKISVIFMLCIILGPLNFVSYKIMYNNFPNEAFFVSQAVNLLYVLIGGVVLSYVSFQGQITEEMRNTPHTKFLVMGSLDCLAGFLAAMGASNTSGAAQQLLNQALIPCTMFASWLFLSRTSSLVQIFGAVIIFLGAWLVVIPSQVVSNDNLSTTSSVPKLIATFLYFSSNIPYSASCVYKEYGFRNLSIHVIYLTQWVSVYQLLIGFVLAPLQMLPGMGSQDGLNMNEILSGFTNGYDCFMEKNQICADNHAFSSILYYCGINFVFNTLGLYLVKHGGATLNAISYAIILPLTTLAFSSHYLGKYTEPYQPNTLYGLVVVLIGFILWKFESVFNYNNYTTTSIIENEKLNEEGFNTVSCNCLPFPEPKEAIDLNPLKCGSLSFQERVIVPIL